MYETSNYLAHYQIKGAKHGIRRWQNYDGSLTPEGRVHYGVGPPRGEGVISDKDINRAKAMLSSGMTQAETAKALGTSVNALKISIDDNIGKNIKSVDYHGKKDLDLNDFKKGLQKFSDQVATARKNAAIRSQERAKEKAEAKERAEKAAEGKRIAEEKLKQEEELAKARAEVDALKEYYVEHPLKIYEARKVLSKEDIKDVENRILFERELKDFRRDEIMRYVKTAGDVADALGTVYKGADNLRKLYNIGADTYNAFVAAKDTSDDKKPLRKIGDGKNMKDTSGKKKQDQNNNQQNQQNQKNQKENSQQQKQAEQPKKKADKPAYVAKVDDRYFYSEDEYKAYKDNQKNKSTPLTQTKVAKLDDKGRSEVAKFAKKFYSSYSNASDSEREQFKAAFNAKVRATPYEDRSPVEQQNVQTVYSIIEQLEGKKK